MASCRRRRLLDPRDAQQLIHQCANPPLRSPRHIVPHDEPRTAARHVVHRLAGMDPVGSRPTCPLTPPGRPPLCAERRTQRPRRLQRRARSATGWPGARMLHAQSSRRVAGGCAAGIGPEGSPSQAPDRLGRALRVHASRGHAGGVAAWHAWQVAARRRIQAVDRAELAMPLVAVNAEDASRSRAPHVPDAYAGQRSELAAVVKSAVARNTHPTRNTLSPHALVGRKRGTTRKFSRTPALVMGRYLRCAMEEWSGASAGDALVVGGDDPVAVGGRPWLSPWGRSIVRARSADYGTP